MSTYDTAKKNESYEPRAKTSQERAQARYSPVANKTPETPVLADAEKNPRGDVPDEFYNGAPQRQLSTSGKVRK